MKNRILILLILFIFGALNVEAQTTLFTYQGTLTDGGDLANGSYDLQFKLFDTITIGTGTQQGSTQTLSNIPVAGGLFSVALNFGACASCFNGAVRFLEIAIKPTGGGVFTTLGPRQQITSTPYALKSLAASAADSLSLTCVSCVTSSQIQSVSGSAVSGQIPVASVPPGSPSYIQNNTVGQNANFHIGGNGNIDGNLTIAGSLTANLPSGDTNYVQNRTSQQLLSNFNISGTGVATQFNAPTFVGADFTGVNFTGNNFSALSNFRINGSRVLAAPGTRNTFVGLQTGTANTGADGSFFGFNAGNANVAGNDNSFFGSDAGGANTSGTDNSFFGSDSGDSNTSGNSNSFFGRSSGHSNTTGDSNTFVGTLAGLANTTGNNNTIIGKSANVGQSNLTFATAIGAGAVVSDSNSVVLGRADGSDVVHIPGPVGIDGTLAVHTLEGVGIGQLCVALQGRITTCSSSLRYKTGVASFLGGLDVVRRLRPIRFTWKEGGIQDIGFAAEEVNEIEPLLATRNKRAEIEGVKYGQLTTVLVNAVKEQQAQIERQQLQNGTLQEQIQKVIRQNQQQQTQIQQLRQTLEGLRRLACKRNRLANICKEEE